MNTINPFSDNVDWVRENLPIPEPVVDTFGDRVEEYTAPYFELAYTTGNIQFLNGRAKYVNFNIRIGYADCKPIDQDYINASHSTRRRMGQEFVLTAAVKISRFIEAMLNKSGSFNNPYAVYFRMDNNNVTWSKSTDQAGEGPNQVWKLIADFQLRVDYQLCEKCL